MRRLATLLLLFGSIAAAQTTQGLISGRLLNSRTGKPIAAASVTYTSAATSETGVFRSDAGGYYFLPLLSPGFYSVQVAAEGYQSQEVQELELRVAARIELDFRLRPLNDIWESGQYNSVFLPGSHTIVTFYGPDVDPSRSSSFEAQRGRRGSLESTLSQVIDPAQVRELPLAGRDVYTMLATMPGVTADTTTTRGLGLSVNGQRPSSSNFLLDGVENNNYLITGPLTVVAPEGLQEYRVSTNNFSAEYGRTAGFVANAVTRAGTGQYHGLGYLYFKNDALNANGFQQNLAGLPRNPDKENQVGFQVGGPILKQKLFFSSAFEHLRSRSQQDASKFVVPSTDFVGNTPPNSLARKLLLQYPAPLAKGANFLGVITLAPPVSINRSLALERVDYSTPSGNDHFMGRVAINRVGRPDFIWTPYQDFISALNQNTTGLAFSWTRAIRPGLTNEARLGFSDDDLHWDRAHPEIPTLVAINFDNSLVTLPGSPAFYAYRNHNRTWEILDNVIRARGRHVITAGAGILFRSLDGFLTAGRDGEYLFQGLGGFLFDSPTFLQAAVARSALPAAVLPQYDREYKYRQYFLFGQDSFKVSSRLTVNYGVRYEQFGAPKNVGQTKDAVVQLGTGSNFNQRLANAQLRFPASGEQEIFHADNHDFAGRFGFSYDLLGNARTLLRGAYGIFYDRPFDNLWQNVRNNNLTLPLVTLEDSPVNYLAPIPSVLARLNGQITQTDFPSLTMFQQDLRNPYAQSYFLGVQQQITGNLVLEVNGQGALGRRLMTTDVVNRQYTTEVSNGRPNGNLPDIAYRAGQGLSNYQALTATARYRTTGAQFQAAYTWSHSIDNQSEPLSGDFFDLSFTAITNGAGRIERSAFSRQYDSRADRGNSDFDQRHNLVIFSLWNLPAPGGHPLVNRLLRDWKLSQLAAFRSGFPYTVRAVSNADFGLGQIVNNRANIIDPGKTVLASPIAVPGGKNLLNASGFSQPGISMLGNSSRNAFHGPGLYNVDLSLARSFPLRVLGESGRLLLRADAFNLLNHANLNNPDPLLNSPTFGVARFGRQGRQSGFPAVTPFNETARQVQLVLRLEF